MHPALIDLLGAVADEARWDASLHGYAASLGADQVGWFVLASGPEQLVPWGSGPPQQWREQMTHFTGIEPAGGPLARWTSLSGT